MLTLPILKNMSGNDLNQRYANSWIKYNDSAVYCQGFSQGERSRLICIAATASEDSPNDTFPFIWTALDTQRPRSRWYVVNNRPCYLSLMVDKQYSRGLNNNNSYTIWPVGNEVPDYSSLYAAYVNEFFKEENQGVGWKLRLSLNFILSYRKEKRTLMLTPYLILQSNGSIWYRTLLVGSLEEDGVIILKRKFIIDEIKECFLDAKIEMSGAYQ